MSGLELLLPVAVLVYPRRYVVEPQMPGFQGLVEPPQTSLDVCEVSLDRVQLIAPMGAFAVARPATDEGLGLDCPLPSRHHRPNRDLLPSYAGVADSGRSFPRGTSVVYSPLLTKRGTLPTTAWACRALTANRSGRRPGPRGQAPRRSKPAPRYRGHGGARAERVECWAYRKDAENE